MIVGVTGPAGAGKDTVADYLASKLKTKHVSGGDILRRMLSKLGLEPKKTALGDFGTFLRTHYGSDVITEMVEANKGEADYLIVSGFRSPIEARERQARGGLVVYIDAPDEVRYERILARQKDHDITTVEMLRKIDEQERASKHAMAENLEAVREIADIVIANDGTLDELHQKLDKLVQELVSAK